MNPCALLLGLVDDDEFEDEPSNGAVEEAFDNEDGAIDEQEHLGDATQVRLLFRGFRAIVGDWKRKEGTII